MVINEHGKGFLFGSPYVKLYFKTDGKTRKTKIISVDNIDQSNYEGRYVFFWDDDDNVYIIVSYEETTKRLSYDFSNKYFEIDVKKNRRSRD